MPGSALDAHNILCSVKFLWLWIFLITKIHFSGVFTFCGFNFRVLPSQLVFDYTPYSLHIYLRWLVSLLYNNGTNQTWQGSRESRKDVFCCCKLIVESCYQNMLFAHVKICICENFSGFKNLWFLFLHLHCGREKHENLHHVKIFHVCGSS